MILRSIASRGLPLILLAGLTAGCTLAHGGRVASAGSVEAGYARQAERALTRHDPAAVALAEAAVQAAPGRSDYRLILARAYLTAGRFVSARQAFSDVLQLEPANARAALNLALTQLACGDAVAAHDTLAAHETTIAPADLGLAYALAGDPDRAVTLLMAVARSPGATAQVRQNLALSLGLGGQWQMARAVAAVDLSPADIDRRMLDWIAFAQSRGKADQVASLLGVTPAAGDLGQPTALALATPAPATAVAEPVGTVLAVQDVPPPPAAAAEPTRIVFGPRREVVQPLPASRVAMADAGPRRRF
jgi:Tfp pilus assembly protein PilF